MINDDSRSDTLEGLLQELADAISKRIECALPCVVTKVSSDRRRVSVRPLIRIVGVTGNTLARDVIEGLPVYQAGAGSFVMSFPVAVGDIGWIEAADRDLGVFLQSYDESDPGSRRKHSFSDAKFVPDIMTNFTISGEDSGAVVIQNRAGTVKIAIDQSEIRIKNGGVSWVATNQDITADVPSGMTINGDLTVNGNVVVSGNITAAGTLSVPTIVTTTVTASGGVSIAGIEFSAHTHPYTWTDPGGSDNTGGPQ